MSSKPPAVLVHGYGDAWYTPWWRLYRRYLRSVGYEDIDSVRLGNLPGTTLRSPEKYAEKVGRRVERVRREHGERPVLFAHSMGGLNSRYYVEEMDGADDVQHLVTVGTPHRGSFRAYLGFFTPGGRDMVPSSDLVKQLNSTPPPDDVEYTAVTGGLDAAVSRENASLPGWWQGEDRRSIHAGPYGHVELLVRKNAFNKYKCWI